MQVGCRTRAAIVTLTILAAGCRAPSHSSPPAETHVPQRSLTAVLANHSPELIRIPGVTTVAESRGADGKPCVLILVTRLTPELRARLPQSLEGWPVVVEESGEIRALPDSAGR